MDQDIKNYEIAYLLSPSIPEEEVLSYATAISAIIEGQKAVIKHVREPKKQRLAYAIEKERNAYLGWITFRLIPESIAGLEKKLKSESSVLRYLLVEEETRLKAPIFRMPVVKPGAAKPTTIPREPEAPEEKLDLEALDKKLEEILGK